MSRTERPPDFKHFQNVPHNPPHVLALFTLATEVSRVKGGADEVGGASASRDGAVIVAGGNV